MRAFRFVGAYKRAAAHSRARGKTASMPALVCVYLIASDAHEPRALTPFLSQVFLTCDGAERWGWGGDGEEGSRDGRWSEGWMAGARNF